MIGPSHGELAVCVIVMSWPSQRSFFFFFPFFDNGRILLVLSLIIIFSFGIGLPVRLGKILFSIHYSFCCFGRCIGIGTVFMSGVSDHKGGE